MAGRRGCTETMRRSGDSGEWREWIWAGAGLWLERVQFSNFTYRNRQTPNRPFGQRPLHNYCLHWPSSPLFPLVLSSAPRCPVSCSQRTICYRCLTCLFTVSDAIPELYANVPHTLFALIQRHR